MKRLLVVALLLIAITPVRAAKLDVGVSVSGSPNQNRSNSFSSWTQNLVNSATHGFESSGSGFSTFSLIEEGTQLDYGNVMYSSFPSWMGRATSTLSDGSQNEFGNEIGFVFEVSNQADTYTRTSPTHKIDLAGISFSGTQTFQGANGAGDLSRTWTDFNFAGSSFNFANCDWIWGFNWNKTTKTWDRVTSGTKADYIFGYRTMGFEAVSSGGTDQATLDRLYAQLNGMAAWDDGMYRRFVSANMILAYDDPADVSYNGETSGSVDFVPEPSAALVLLSGIAGLGMYVIRRRK